MSHDNGKADIDDLSSDLAASFVLAPEEQFSTDAPHPRYALVKPRKSVTGQNERRRLFLNGLRERRADFYALAHGIARGTSPDVGGTQENSYDNDDSESECAVEIAHGKRSEGTEVVKGVSREEAGSDQVRDNKGHVMESVAMATEGTLKNRGTKRRGSDDDDSTGQSNKWRCQDEVVEPAKLNHTQKERAYRDQLMLSEWMVDKPDNLATEWFMKTCPIGKRCMVVSSQGQTRAYKRNGYCIARFDSALPGGRSLGRISSEYCILDCILDEQERIFHVLDVMCWRSQPLYDSDTEFRFFWIQMKLQETDGIGQASRYNPYRFTVIPYTMCDDASIRTLLATSQKECAKDTDGILFYEKQVHYCKGRNPAVLWLKLHMLEDILCEGSAPSAPT